MISTFVKPLTLRVGHHTSGFGSRGDGRGVAIRFEEAENFNWDVQGALAVVDPGDGAGSPARTLESLGVVLREAAESAEPLSSLGPDVLRRVSERQAASNGKAEGVPTRTGLTLILVGSESYYVVRDGPAPAYILRGGSLVALPLGSGTSETRMTMAGANGEEPVAVTPVQSPEAQFGSGELEDGDALIVCNYSLLSCRSEAEISRALLHSSSPRMAAGRLAEECHQRGAKVSVAALFAGVNPSAAPAKVEPEPLPALAAPAPATFSVAPVSAAPPTFAALPPPAPSGAGFPTTNWVAALAGLAGACMGVAIGVLIAVSLLRPLEGGRSGRETIAPTTAPAPSWTDYTPPNPVAPYSGGAPGFAQSSGYSAQPAATGNTSVSAVRPSSTAFRPGPVSISGLPPATPSSTPTPHAVDGPTARVQLTLALHQQSGLVVMTTNQGVLYSGDAPLGVPAGEYIAADPGVAFRNRAADPALELRIVQGQQVASMLRGEDLRKLLTGAPVAVPDLAPGDYKLAWWSSADGQPATPFVNLRIGGI